MCLLVWWNYQKNSTEIIWNGKEREQEATTKQKPIIENAYPIIVVVHLKHTHNIQASTWLCTYFIVIFNSATDYCFSINGDYLVASYGSKQAGSEPLECLTANPNGILIEWCLNWAKCNEQQHLWRHSVRSMFIGCACDRRMYHSHPWKELARWLNRISVDRLNLTRLGTYGGRHRYRHRSRCAQVERKLSIINSFFLSVAR